MVGHPAQGKLALAGASIVVLRGDSVLLVERRHPPLDALWSFPGGKAREGETPQATARRELLEETGLRVGELAPLGVFQPAPELTPLVLSVFSARGGPEEPLAGDDARQAEYVRLAHVLVRRLTPGAPGWIARAILAHSDPPLL